MMCFSYDVYLTVGAFIYFPTLFSWGIIPLQFLGGLSCGHGLNILEDNNSSTRMYCCTRTRGAFSMFATPSTSASKFTYICAPARHFTTHHAVSSAGSVSPKGFEVQVKEKEARGEELGLIF